MSAFWTRAGTWGIASTARSQLAVVLPVVSWPRPTPQLCLRCQRGSYFGCGSKNDKLRILPNLETRLTERLCCCRSLSLLLGSLLDWWLGTEVSECLLSGPAKARGGLPPARSQLEVVLPVISRPRPTPQLCLRC